MTLTSRLYNALLIALVGVWTGACVDEVALPPRSIASRLVVEGLITNEPPPYTVKLTFPKRFPLPASLIFPRIVHPACAKHWPDSNMQATSNAEIAGTP